MDTWKSNVEQINTLLAKLSVLDNDGKTLNTDDAFNVLKLYTEQVRDSKNTIFFVGNGASASMASHVSADLAKNGKVHTQGFFDLSLITAIANDISYEDVFAEPLRNRMEKGDVLVAISSSGNSPNVVKAIKQAKQLGGVVISVSAMSENNKIRQMGDLNFYVPATSYGMAETCHAALLHYWIDLVVE